jgi:hypothetical protein
MMETWRMVEGSYDDVELATGVDDVEGGGAASQPVDATEVGLMSSEPHEPLLW